MAELPPLFADVWPICRDDAVALAAAFQVLADPTRLHIISLFTRFPEMTNTDVADYVPLSQPSISHQMAILARSGLIERRREGVWSVYRLVPDRFAELAATLRGAR